MGKTRKEREKGRRGIGKQGRKGGKGKKSGEKKLEGGKGRKRLSNKRLIFVVFIVATVFFGYFLLSSILGVSEELPAKAAIVDHLSIWQPNQTFVQAARSVFEAANFSVDYYGGEEVTVDFYRSLPKRGYGVIVLRVHSTNDSLFSSEPYSKEKYASEQETGQLMVCGFLPYSEGDPTYFGIHPKFVRRSMKGRFQNTIIIAMGCNGLSDPEMAEAFIERGATVYISWNEEVSQTHTDYGTIHLLQRLVVEKQTVRKAVEETMKEVGPDPTYGSRLLYYPEEVGEYTATPVGIIPMRAARDSYSDLL